MKIYFRAFKILKLLYNIYLYFFDYFIILSCHSQQAKNKILIIRLDSIGDFILWLDSARHFKKIYPDKRIILLGNKVWAGLAKRFPYWNEVWSVDRQKFNRNLLYRLKLLRKIYKAGFDIAIQPTYSREFSYGDAIIRISGAKERIGSIGDYCNIRPLEKKISDKFYTRLIPAIQCPLMELKRNAEFVCGLDMRVHAGLPDISPAIDGMKNPLNTVSDYYVLFPGASRSGKQWPIDRFTALSNKIYGKYGLTGVICGSPAEQDLVQELILHINVPIINMTGKTNLVNLAVIIRNALFLVANDTSAIHIAAAVSTPGFCILGGWHYGRFIPYDIENKMEKPLPIPITHEMDCSGCNWRCQYPYEKSGPVPCIEKISVDEVFSVIEDKINKMKKA